MGINSISVKKETLITILEIFVLAAVYDYNHNFYDTWHIHVSGSVDVFSVLPGCQHNLVNQLVITRHHFNLLLLLDLLENIICNTNIG